MNRIYSSDEGRRLVHARYAELLRRWPVPSAHHSVPTREGDTFVVACGPAAAPPLVLLQGSGANAAMWIRDVEQLASRHRVYAVDVVGEPGLSAESRPPLDSDRHAVWLDDVIEQLGVKCASFVGVSFGGWIVLDYAIRRPDRIERVAVVNPSGVGARRSRFMFEAAALMLLGRWGRRKSMARAVGPMTGQAHPLDREVGALALVIAKHFRHRRGRLPLFSDDHLRRLTMPVLAILGARDALLDAHGTKRRLEQFAPRVSIRLLPDAGHVVRDHTAAMLAFLTSEPAIA